MRDNKNAALYYGYATEVSENRDELDKKIEEIKESLDITAAEIDSEGQTHEAVIGKRISKAGDESLEKITASELLQHITSIKNTDKLNETLKELGLDDEDPKLIICSEV